MTFNSAWLKPILLLVALVTITLLSLLTTTNYLTQKLKNEAIDGCLQTTGIYEYTDTKQGIHTTAPQKDSYRLCLVDKGYQTSWK